MEFLGALQRIVQNLGYRGDVSDFIVVFGLALGRVASAISLTPFAPVTLSRYPPPV